MLDYAAARRPDVDVPTSTRTPGLIRAEWGEHTRPTDGWLRSIEQKYGTVDRKTLVLAAGTSTNAGMASGMDALSSTVTWADTIYIYMGSWIDPDPSQWIYFGSYTSSSHPIAYSNVTGYTFVDENAWATLFDETYQGWGPSVSLGYPYFSYGGVFFEQVGHHFAQHSIFQANEQSYVWWYNI